jgi:hypothetical protein
MGRHYHGWRVWIYEPDRACRRPAVSDMGLVPQLPPFGICRNIVDILRNHQLDEGSGIFRFGAVQYSEHDVDGCVYAARTGQYICWGLVGQKSFANQIQRDHQPVDDRRWTGVDSTSHLVMASSPIWVKAPSASGGLPCVDAPQSWPFQPYRPEHAAVIACPAVGVPIRGHENAA